MQYVGSRMKEAVPGPKLRERVHALAESLGPFETHDHAGAEKPPKLSADSPEKQENRQRKFECLKCSEEGSPTIGRMSAKTLREKGAPLCPVHKLPMWHEPLPDPPKPEPPPLQIAFQPEGDQ
jgi:hypothetical protein